MTMHTETETPTTHSAMADGETSVPILQLKDVSYAYAKGGRNVLSDINYTFPSGSVTAIVGPSGAGKTTLLSLISGLTTPTGGEVLFEGHNLAKMDRYCYRSRDIGVIFQSFNLLPGLTVLENIMLTMDASGKRFDRPKRDIALDLLKQVHLPERYANERILHLSGGEQQRVAIARALAKNPKILLCDEPTGALDYNTGKAILKLLHDTCRSTGTTVIIITHNQAICSMADRVIKIKNGKVTENTVNAEPLPAERIEW